MEKQEAQFLIAMSVLLGGFADQGFMYQQLTFTLL
jgi:hypothetical protein